MQNYRLGSIQKQINGIKKKLQEIGEMRPGYLSRQFVSQNDKKYPYYQISYTYNMKSHTDYVKKEFVKDMKRQLNNYRRFKKLVKCWIDLAMIYSKLKLDIALKKR